MYTDTDRLNWEEYIFETEEETNGIHHYSSVSGYDYIYLDGDGYLTSGINMRQAYDAQLEHFDWQEGGAGSLDDIRIVTWLSNPSPYTNISISGGDCFRVYAPQLIASGATLREAYLNAM